ncbi:hypothetical protein KsCSTR_16740 [Candidatus Kuenenia stuttgartiensis]|uniref:Uncharacterized protein n=1 Tax=Kuenenia stuttgartiensis TaxID=174633 RepID=Q1Q1Y8_KUEST|nr:hypothetical protein KsCSTR_16740 [Candidatus Kuenenia stuttgartiensis]CAJ74021.1 unknown protein [Candidatus Kuenenia stuttgartiensis]
MPNNTLGIIFFSDYGKPVKQRKDKPLYICFFCKICRKSNTARKHCDLRDYTGKEKM